MPWLPMHGVFCRPLWPLGLLLPVRQEDRVLSPRCHGRSSGWHARGSSRSYGDLLPAAPARGTVPAAPAAAAGLLPQDLDAHCQDLDAHWHVGEGSGY